LIFVIILKNLERRQQQDLHRLVALLDVLCAHEIRQKLTQDLLESYDGEKLRLD